MTKPSKNDPCPCGSGRRYKRCCLNKDKGRLSKQEHEINESKPEPLPLEHETSIVENEKSVDNGILIDDEILVDNEKLMIAFNNMRLLLLEKKPHIKEYKKARKIHGELTDKMMDYLYDGKFQQKVDPNYVSPPDTVKHGGAKKRNIVLLEADFDPNTREGIQGLCESVLYKAAPNLSCITEEFIKNNVYKKPEKIEMLQSMLDSQSGLFEVTGTDSAEGYAYIREVFSGREYTLTDIGMSGDSKANSNIYIYTRIITYKNISFGTGLSLLFDKNDPFIINFIKSEKIDYSPLGEYKRFIDLFNRAKDNTKFKVVTSGF